MEDEATSKDREAIEVEDSCDAGEDAVLTTPDDGSPSAVDEATATRNSVGSALLTSSVDRFATSPSSLKVARVTRSLSTGSRQVRGRYVWKALRHAKDRSRR